MLETGYVQSPTPSAVLSPGTDQGRKGDGEKGFKEIVEAAMDSVNQDISTANNMSRKMATGEDVDIAETMIAISRADISFRMMLQVRNKALSAYEEIMRMQV